MKNFLKLNKLEKVNIWFIYLIYIIFVTLVTIYFTNKFITKYPQIIDNNLNIILNKIPFAFGNLINNLFYQNNYTLNDWGMKMHVARLPVVPYLISSLYFFFKNIYFFLIFKNIIFFSIYFFILFQFIKSFNIKINFLLLLLIPILCNHYNFTVLLNFVYEDFVIAILVPSLFLSIISKNKFKYIISAIIIFVLYLTKVNMFFLTIIISIIIFALEKNKRKIIPIIAVLFAIFTWGFYGLLKTNKFPIGQSMISINSWNMSHVLNDNFKNFYPKNSVDLIEFPDKHKKFENEWEFYNFYYQKNNEYLLNNKLQVLHNIVLKIKFIFFDIYHDGNQTFKLNDNQKILISNIENKFFLNLSILILALSFYNSVKKRKIQKFDLYYFFLLTFYILPLIIGWATSKHLVGIFIVSKIYLILKFMEKKRIFNQ
jgi:hypothetical protein